MWQTWLLHIQTQPWLYALVVGSAVFAIFWLMDHAGSYWIVRFIPLGTAPFKRHLVGLFRRVLLLCATGIFAVGDYLYLLPSHWKGKMLYAVALPIAAIIVGAWLVIESRLIRHVVLGDTTLRSWWQQQVLVRTPQAIGQEPRFGIGDFLAMAPAQKMHVLSSDAYGQLSDRLNRVLYLLTWAHLVGWVYTLRAPNLG